MIPRDFITAWRSDAPWSQDAQVEQDLVISRALIEMFRIEGVAQALAFRGGTALYKLHLRPAARYSEDIDLVQVQAQPIGETLDLVRSALDPWLGTPRRKFKERRVNLVYRFDSEDAPSLKLRLKVEINSREHFTEMGLRRIPVTINNRWFTDAAAVTTFDINELLGTTLRALYQRKKGRDLFDLWFALHQRVVDSDALIRCFSRYMAESDQQVSRAQFEANPHHKARDNDFRGDIIPLLRPGIPWDFDEALTVVSSEIIRRLPGDGWRGEGE